MQNTHRLLSPPPYRRHFVVYRVSNPPPSSSSSFAVCHTFLLTLIHVLMRILSIDFSFFTPMQSRDGPRLHHMSTLASLLRRPGSAVLLNANATSSSICWHETQIPFNAAAFSVLSFIVSDFFLKTDEICFRGRTVI